jgi:hypothetical protein
MIVAGILPSISRPLRQSSLILAARRQLFYQVILPPNAAHVRRGKKRLRTTLKSGRKINILNCHINSL